MKGVFKVLFYLFFISSWGQTDYSGSWEDFFSYNNVKDFVKTDNTIYAVVDNAVFSYDTSTNVVEKLSSVNGLSGETSSSIYYSAEYKRLVIGNIHENKELL